MKPAVVAIHVLHVDGAAHAFPVADVDILMREALMAGKGSTGLVASVTSNVSGASTGCRCTCSCVTVTGPAP